MTADSYEEKEKLLRRKHELEWENFKARREKAEAENRGLPLSATMVVANLGPDPFEVEALELRERQSAELLALIKEKLAAPAEAKLPDIEPAKVPMTRKDFVLRILNEKGWSILDWANEAEVAYHTAADYLEGKTSPYRATRLKLATALGISVDELPD